MQQVLVLFKDRSNTSLSVKPNMSFIKDNFKPNICVIKDNLRKEEDNMYKFYVMFVFKTLRGEKSREKAAFSTLFATNKRNPT